MLCNALPSVELLLMMMMIIVVRTRAGALAVVGGMSTCVGYDCWACLLLLIDIHTMMMLMLMFAFVSSLIMIASYYYILYNII